MSKAQTNHKKKRRRAAGVNPVLRAVVAHEWSHTAVEARIVALCSMDSHALVNKAGRLLYVVLGAAIAQKMDPDRLELRIVRGAVNAVHDQAGEAVIPDQRRASIINGLNTASILTAELPRKALIDAACDLAAKLRTSDVYLADFQAMLRLKQRPD